MCILLEKCILFKMGDTVVDVYFILKWGIPWLTCNENGGYRG